MLSSEGCGVGIRPSCRTNFDELPGITFAVTLGIDLPAQQK